MNCSLLFLMHHGLFQMILHLMLYVLLQHIEAIVPSQFYLLNISCVLCGDLFVRHSDQKHVLMMMAPGMKFLRMVSGIQLVSTGILSLNKCGLPIMGGII